MRKVAFTVKRYAAPAGSPYTFRISNPIESQAIAHHLFQAPFHETVDRIATASGAIPGSTVRIEGTPDKHLWVSAHHPNLSLSRAYKLEPRTGRLIVKHVFQTARGPMLGGGYKRFAEVLKHLRYLNVDEIQTDAGGHKGHESNGYYTWPRFGFNGQMEEFQFRKLPHSIQNMMKGARDFHTLFSLPGKDDADGVPDDELSGAGAWKRYGSFAPDLDFDLAPDSEHSKRWEAYHADRLAREQAKPRGFARRPTHVPQGRQAGVPAGRETIPATVGGGNQADRAGARGQGQPRGVRRFAKVDGHEAAHPLVAGFPIEHALRKLANDPSAGGNVRDLAAIALTGKNKLTGEVKPEGMPEALWMLHDALRDEDHPDATLYNWQNAGDKVLLDQHTHTALQEEADAIRRRHRVPAARRNVWAWRPEAQASQAGEALSFDANGKKSKQSPDPYVQRYLAKLNRIRSRVSELSGDTDIKRIDESIRRHAIRANMAWRAEHGINTQEDVERATTPHSDTETVHNASHKAGRYKRRFSLRMSPGEGVSYTHADFHRAIHENPGEATNWLAYADWLEEQGKPVLARSIREHVQYGVEALNDPAMYLRSSIASMPEAEFRGWQPGTAQVGEYPSGTRHHRFLSFDLRSAVDPSKLFVINGQHYLGDGGKSFKEATREGHLEAGSPPTRPDYNSPNPDTIDHNKTKLRRRYSLAPRGDFIDSLRRIRSSNQKVLHDVAQKVGKQLGLTPVRTYDGLYDTQRGSVPGIVQAVYGRADPTKVHAAAAWPTLIGNGRGTAVFHVRPTGVDTLYKLKHPGSGLDIRDKLDRAGIPARVLMLPADPGFAGFDVLIPDRGSKIGRQVADYARRQGIKVQASRGHMTTAGSADQGKTRAKMRGAVARSEG